MKIVRLLVYEGSKEAIEKHFSQVFVANPNLVYGSPHQVEIREVFRGEQEDPKVVHFEEDDIPF